MQEITQIIKKDMVPALGVTEPGAIAFAVAKAKTLISGALRHITVSMNSGLYKNAYTCGIPNADAVGSAFAAALGYAAGNADNGLEALNRTNERDAAEAKRLVDQGFVTVKLLAISSRIELLAFLETAEGTAEVEIRDQHARIVRMAVNGAEVFRRETGAEAEQEHDSESALIQSLTLRDMLDYADSVPLQEIQFVKNAHQMNLALFREGLSSAKTTFVHHLLKLNGEKIISADAKKTASLLCNGAIEARVLGLNYPAMSITGSGAHGIMATLPLYAEYAVKGLSEEKLLRATVLSFLICMYIKAYSGRLSALCGCAIAGGTGAACGLCYLRGGGEAASGKVIDNMASGLTGMICDGGNQGCVMKGIAACEMAYNCADLALAGVYVDSVHGINGRTPEETMRNIGLIASPGMTQTEKTIVDIQQSKGYTEIKK